MTRASLRVRKGWEPRATPRRQRSLFWARSRRDHSVGNPSNTSHDRWGVGYRMIAIRVVDKDQAVEYLQRKGVGITEGPATLGPTVKRTEIEDPDGLPIELRQW